MPDTPPRVALVGFGPWGRNLARNLAALKALAAVAEPSEEGRAAAREAYPDVPVVASMDEAKDVDAVCIAAPAAEHARLALAALERGLDVFVEKPLALTFADGQEVWRRAQERERVLMVGHLLEYHPAVEALDRLVQEGALGEVQYLYSNRLHLGRFRREENALWSFAPHDLSVILRLVGQQPLEVLATGGAYLQAGVADTTVTHLLFEHGVRAHVFVSWLHPYKEQRLVVVGAQKMAVFDDRAPHPEKLVLYDKGATWEGGIPTERRGEGEAVPISEEEPLRREVAHFLRCIQTRQTPLTDGRNGLRVLRVLQAAQQSLAADGVAFGITGAMNADAVPFAREDRG